MPALAAPVIYEEPYGLAIAKENAGTEMEKALVWALVK